MIRELKGRSGLFFPRRLINEIVRWILGICSPTGTIKIGNTAHPQEGQSMSLDVDVGAVAGRVAKRIGNRPLTANQRKDVCDVIRTHVDEVSVVWRDGGLAVNEEWAKKFGGDSLISPPSSNVTKDKVLTVLKGGTAVSWEDAAAQNHSSPKNLTVSGEGTAAAKTGSSNQWTCDGTQGVTFTVQTRTYYDHTASTPVLYGFYRTFTYDRNGRLYSVSAETRYEIDTPVVGNLTT